MEISVVIPSYKSEKTIVRAVESVLNQSAITPYVIVVEDGVFDNTQSELEKFLDHPNFKLISYSDNQGGQYARNLGLKSVKTKYVMFLDSDDYIQGCYLSNAVHTMETNSGDICLNPWIDKSVENNSGVYQPPKNLTSIELIKYWILNGYFIPPVGIVWKSSFVRKIGGWLPSLKKNQDGELVHRALLNSPVLCSNFKGCGVYWHDNSLDRVSMSSPERIVDSLEMTYMSLHKLMLKNSLDDLLASQCYKNARVTATMGYKKEARLWLQRSKYHGVPMIKGYKYHKALDCFLGFFIKEKLILGLKYLQKKQSTSGDFSARYILSEK